MDLVAGVTVGLVALPLAMAFAISSGLQPQAGIYCAIVTGFLISALGGSRYQIGGPTGAFVVVVSAIVAEHGIEGLFMCTMMAGLLLVAAGCRRAWHSGAVHSAARHNRLHERHRPAHRQHPDKGLLRHRCRARSRRLPRPAPRAGRPGRLLLSGSHGARIGIAADDDWRRPVRGARAADAGRAARRDRGRSAGGPPGRHDREPVRRDPGRAAEPARAGLPA